MGGLGSAEPSEGIDDCMNDKDSISETFDEDSDFGPAPIERRPTNAS